MRDTRKLRICCVVVVACWTVPQAAYCVLHFDPWLAPGLFSNSAASALLAAYVLLAVLAPLVLVLCGRSLAGAHGGWRWLAGWALLLGVGFAYEVFAMLAAQVLTIRPYDPGHKAWILLGTAAGFVVVALALVAALTDSPRAVLAASLGGLASALHTPLGRVVAVSTAIAVLVAAALVIGSLRAGLARPGTSVPGTGATVAAVAFSPDGGTLAVADSSGEVTLQGVDPVTGALAAGARPDVIPGTGMSPNALAFSPGGHALAIGGENGGGDGEVELWDTVTRRRVSTLGGSVTQAPVRSLAFTADGNVLAAGDGSGVTSLWDAKTGRLLARLGIAQPVNSVGADNIGIDALAFSPDGSLLATVTYSGGVTLWRTGTRQEAGSILVPPTSGGGDATWADPDAVAFRDGVDYSVEIGVGRCGVYLWDVSTGSRRTVASWPSCRSRDYPIALSANGDYALIGGPTVELWDLSYPGTVQEWADPLGYPIASVALSPDGPVAFGDNDGGPGADVTFPAAAYVRY